MKTRLTRSQAIKRYCRYQCSGNDLKSWRFCKFKDCYLFLYRLGREDTKQDEKEAVLCVKDGLKSKSREDEDDNP